MRKANIFFLIAALFVVGFSYIQRLRIDNLELKNSNLEQKLKQCKADSKAKEFESRWDAEFNSIYNFDINNTGIEDEKENNSTNSYSTYF